MRVLVTGASGFVGANLMREAIARGADVIGYTLRPVPRSVRDFVERHEGRVIWGQLDVRRRQRVDDAIRKAQPDVVIHAAAVTVSRGPTHDMLATQVQGTLNVLFGSHRAGASRVVLLSSGAVYGQGYPCPPRVDEESPLWASSPYAVSKMAAEEIGRDFADRFGLSVAICRLGSLYGAMEMASEFRPFVSLPRRVADLAIRNEVARVYGPEWKRPFLNVSDAARAILDLGTIETPSTETETFNLDAAERSTLSDMLEAVAGFRPGFRYELVDAPRDADVVMTAADERPVLDSARLQSLIGRREWCSIEEGLRRLLEDS